MLPNTLDNSNNQTPYAVAKLEEAARVVKQSINELTMIRKRLDRYKDNKPKAREVYTYLQQQHGRLLMALGTCTLALSEMELPDIAEYSVKLSQSLKSFILMTLDYTKLCAALNGYLSKLPISDTPEAKTTNVNPDEAERMVSNNWRAGDYILDSENFVGVEFEAVVVGGAGV